MVNASSIYQILSSPGAIAQDLDGSFFIFTQARNENRPSPKGVFTPLYFDLSGTQYQGFTECLKIERHLLIQALEALDLKEESAFSPTWHLQPHRLFDEDFQSIQQLIGTGRLEKAVVMTVERAEGAPSPPQRAQMLLRLLQNCPNNLFIYGHWQDHSGVLGATPELLFSRSGHRVKTMALAGTLARKGLQTPSAKNSETLGAKDSLNTNAELAQRLLNDPKERHEHQLVVEDLTEKLQAPWPLAGNSAIAPSGQVHIHGPQVIELPHLMHLHTAIEVVLPESLDVHSKNFAESVDYQLIQRLHPSSALGLRSKVVSWSWLKTLNGHQELGHFGAPFGFNTADGFLCFVGIRNLEWSTGVSLIRAGCGLVRGSQPDREWQELSAKRDSVKALLGIK